MTTMALLAIVMATMLMATMVLLAIVMALLAIVMGTMITIITENPVAPTSRDTLTTTVEVASTMTTTLMNAPGIIG
jgi:hypothetical protein